jgi:hypothetical protein
MRIPRPLVLAAALACQGGPKSTTPAPEPLAHSLSGLAAQPIAVLPTYAVRTMPGLDWAQAMGRPADVQRTFDADIAAALEARGLGKTWIFPAQLEQSYRRNATYATNPYGLAEEPLRSPSIASESRLPEPLASQLRTLVALHEDARLILAPVELRFEKAGTGGRGALRIMLIDPRFSKVLWMGEIVSDPVPEFNAAISAEIAAKLANVIAAP